MSGDIELQDEPILFYDEEMTVSKLIVLKHKYTFLIRDLVLLTKSCFLYSNCIVQINSVYVNEKVFFKEICESKKKIAYLRNSIFLWKTEPV